jgi:trans-aconitate 2-methyltransferase
MRWDPHQYARYADERSRPFFDLVDRIHAASPSIVLDVGCGSAELTATLIERWPSASVRAIDSSAEMVAAAPAVAGLTVTQGSAQDVDARGVDVLVSNAALQWVPDHLPLLATWADQLAPDGWLAVQVPSNFGAPSHRLMRELADSPRWRGRLAGVLRGEESVATPAAYLGLLADAGLAVDAWQTEYEHVLSGPDPVLTWVRGTGLRPVLAALDAQEAAAFSDQYAALLRTAYPARPYGTVFGFRRTFVVAHKPA